MGLCLGIAGGLFGFVATWFFAFVFYNVPYTTTGAKEVVMAVAPFAVLFGCLFGGFVAYHWPRKK
jgi:hypothetical protein